MGQLIEFQEILKARRRERERDSLQQCIALLEWNLEIGLSNYLHSPHEERAVRAGRLKKLSELLEYAYQIS